VRIFPLTTSTTAIGISDSGEIAGFYDDAAGTTACSPVFIPLSLEHLFA
jgi:hypothetical protein